MNKHTPGPWKIAKRRSIVHDNDGWDVAAVSPRKWDGQQIANARLIAAAPELLDLLKSAIARVELANAEGNNILSAWLPDAKAIVTKIERGEL